MLLKQLRQWGLIKDDLLLRQNLLRGFLIVQFCNEWLRGIGMHLSLERLMSTTVLLGLVLAIMPQISSVTSLANQTLDGTLRGISQALLDLWVIDLVAISISVDHIALSISTIPFLCILPTFLLVSVGTYEVFLRGLILAAVTFCFVIARYVANSL